MYIHVFTVFSISRPWPFAFTLAQPEISCKLMSKSVKINIYALLSVECRRGHGDSWAEQINLRLIYVTVSCNL